MRPKYNLPPAPNSSPVSNLILGHLVFRDQMFGKGKKAKAREEEHEAVIAAEKESHESQEAKSFDRGQYEGLREACSILDHVIETEENGSDDESSLEVHKALNKARKRIAKRADKAYDETHDQIGRTL